ncbi:hypothetical protein, partial [Streptomyces griseorubiginosus]|uniref:hypothetical protein n=1 Tax=Streptomyces griseorubiginosus TaxID=67304 RepID=UPI001AD7D4CD
GVYKRQVHAPTGPGFNVYACQECAPHYPPRQDALDLLDSTHRRSRLTLRIYTLDAGGAVTADSGRLEIVAGGRAEPVPRTSAYPPCACPRCSKPR